MADGYRYKMITVDEVLQLTGWSLQTLNRRVAAGTFPEPAEGGRGKNRKWFLAQYERWAKQKMDMAEAEVH